MAAILRILSMSFIRPGSEIYANENGSYGIATLRPRHVSVKGDRITFEFPGKSGQDHKREIRRPAGRRDCERTSPIFEPAGFQVPGTRRDFYPTSTAAPSIAI